MIYIHQNSSIGGLSVRERLILGAFLRSQQSTVQVDDLVRGFNLNRLSANKVLSRLAQKGWLQRVRRGVYLFVPLESSSPNPMPEHPWTVAMELFKPCFISG